MSSSLPISNHNHNSTKGEEEHLAILGGMRRRLSSLSLHVHSKTTTTAWSFRRSKSMSSFITKSTGTSIRNLWEWGWNLIMSRKKQPASSSYFGNHNDVDLELLNHDEQAHDEHNNRSLRQVFYKLRAEIRKLVRSNRVGLPQTARYDSFNYAQNFDDGNYRSHTSQ